MAENKDIQMTFSITDEMVVFAIAQAMTDRIVPLQTKDDLYREVEVFIREFGYQALVERNPDDLDDDRHYQKRYLERAQSLVNSILEGHQTT